MLTSCSFINRTGTIDNADHVDGEPGCHSHDRGFLAWACLDILLLLPLAFSLTGLANINGLSTAESSATILVYHRFGSTAAHSMTVTTSVFESQLNFLRDHSCRML